MFFIKLNDRSKQISEDVLVILLSIVASIFILETGFVTSLPAILGGYGYIGIFVAGIGFTSVFTTAPAITVLTVFAGETDPLVVSTLGGLGAMFGDYVIFRFVRDRVYEDIKYLMSLTHIGKYKAVFKTRLFHYFTPFVGALIVASPFPDEIGLTILGFSKIQNNIFLPLVFILNTLGILFIVSIIASI